MSHDDIQKEDIGRKVLYKPSHGPIEEGVLVGFNSSYVFVRFGAGVNSKACHPESLEFLA